MKNKLSKNNIKDKTNKNGYNKSTTPDKMQNTLKFLHMKLDIFSMIMRVGRKNF